MKFSNKYSGSRGNLTIVKGKKFNLLIDCGGGTNMFFSALKEENLAPSDVDAILVTHEHSDHISSLETLLCYNDKAKIFVHKNGYNALCPKVFVSSDRIWAFDAPFEVGEFFVESYMCSHDSAFCCGYKITQDDGLSVASVTDTGVVRQAEMESFFSNCHTVLLESNHDRQMVLSGNYPLTLKQRILGDKGHLSNRQAGEIVCRLPSLNVKNVFLAHLSLENNSEEIAFKEAVDSLASVGAKDGKDLNLFVARQFYGGKSINVEK